MVYVILIQRDINRVGKRKINVVALARVGFSVLQRTDGRRVGRGVGCMDSFYSFYFLIISVESLTSSHLRDPLYLLLILEFPLLSGNFFVLKQ